MRLGGVDNPCGPLFTKVVDEAEVLVGPKAGGVRIGLHPQLKLVIEARVDIRENVIVQTTIQHGVPEIGVLTSSWFSSIFKIKRNYTAEHPDGQQLRADCLVLVCSAELPGEVDM